MPDPTYIAAIEFVAGSYTSVVSDCLSFNVVRALADPLHELTMGRALVVLDNGTAKYSPNNAASPYYGLLKMGTAIRLQATHSSSTYNLFQGTVEAYRIDPVLGGRRVTLECYDLMRHLKDRSVDTPMLVDYNVSSVFTEVFTRAGLTSAQYAIDRVDDTVPFFWVQDRKAVEVMNELLNVGHYYSYVDGGGALRVRSRYFQIEKSVVASYINDFMGLTYALNTDTVLNQARISGQLRRQATAVQTIAWLREIVTIAASSGIGFFLDYVDPDQPAIGAPANNVVTPVSSTDYYTNTTSDNTGADRTAQTSVTVTKFGESAICSLYNGSADAIYVTRFQLRGNSVQLQPAIAVQSDVASSQTIYGRKTFTLDSPYLGNILYARDYADYMAQKFADPVDQIALTLKNQYPDVLAREVGDLIFITESETAVNTSLSISEIDHTVSLSRGLEHVLRLKVYLPQGASAGNVLILDDPVKGKLDSGRRLGF